MSLHRAARRVALVEFSRPESLAFRRGSLNFLLLDLLASLSSLSPRPIAMLLASSRPVSTAWAALSAPVDVNFSSALGQAPRQIAVTYSRHFVTAASVVQRLASQQSEICVFSVSRHCQSWLQSCHSELELDDKHWREPPWDYRVWTGGVEQSVSLWPVAVGNGRGGTAPLSPTARWGRKRKKAHRDDAVEQPSFRGGSWGSRHRVAGVVDAGRHPKRKSKIIQPAR